MLIYYKDRILLNAKPGDQYLLTTAFWNGVAFQQFETEKYISNFITDFPFPGKLQLYNQHNSWAVNTKVLNIIN